MFGLNQNSSNLQKDHPDEDSMETKWTQISDLPEEILLHIFSFLNVRDLYSNVRLVCLKWQRLSKVASSWKTVTVGSKLPTQELHNWIQFSPNIRHLKINNRLDTDLILEAVSKHLSNLESISIETCWGSPKTVCVRGETLCKLLTSCNELKKINLVRVQICSYNFFKLLRLRRNQGKSVELHYDAPLTPRHYGKVVRFCSRWLSARYI